MRVTDLAPQLLIDELLRLYALDKDWMRIERVPNNPDAYTAISRLPTWMKKLWNNGASAFNMYAVSRWLGDGPKVFRPSREQCEALEQIEVRLPLEDYAQPYPAVMVVADYPPFTCCLCHHDPVQQYFVGCLFSADHNDDITMTIQGDGKNVEESIRRFDEDCMAVAPVAHRLLRVAINSCLVLCDRQLLTAYLFPKEAERDCYLAGEQSDRGVRARRRLKLAVRVVSFAQEIVLHRSHPATGEEAVATGQEMSPHWRRGHWAMQPYGPRAELRKRILRPPTRIRWDLFDGEDKDTSTVYH